MVELIENLGVEAHIHAHSDVAGPLVIRTQGAPSVKVGEKISLTPGQGQVHRFDVNGQRFNGRNSLVAAPA